MALQRGIPKRFCPACAGNRHGSCLWHEHDGNGDHTQFYDSGCECPCEGEVYGQGLIGLVGELRASLAKSDTERVEWETTAKAQAGAMEKLDRVFADLVADITRPDDEGNRLADTHPHLGALAQLCEIALKEK
jgi:hypothetical protein